MDGPPTPDGHEVHAVRWAVSSLHLFGAAASCLHRRGGRPGPKRKTMRARSSGTGTPAARAWASSPRPRTGRIHGRSNHLRTGRRLPLRLAGLVGGQRGRLPLAALNCRTRWMDASVSNQAISGYTILHNTKSKRACFFCL
ncbi:hypothetical protein VPH35_098701 [Triticum aestivum]